MANLGTHQVLIGLCVALIIVATFIIIKKLVLGRDHFTLNDTVVVVSNVDGMPYRVQPAHKDPQAAADTLARLNKRIITLMRGLKRTYGQPTPQMHEEYPARVRAVGMLLRRFNPDNLAENSALDPSGDTAFTLDKGALIAICLRERDPKIKSCVKFGCKNVDPTSMKLQDIDLLTFVTIHEMAHVAIDELNHPPEFWQTFKFLLDEANRDAVLDAKKCNYGMNSQMYCGMQVNYNPLYDPMTPAIS